MSMILALSDTHLTGPLPEDNMNYYPPRLRELIAEADLVLHAGDFTCQEAYDNLVKLCIDSKCELWAIQGNNPIQKAVPIRDYSRNENGDLLPTQKADERFGIKIGLFHNVVDSHDLSCVLPVAAKNAQDIKMENTGDVGADVLVFGHIHEPVIKWYTEGDVKRRLLVCLGPGSSEAIDIYHNCPPDPTVALLECHNGNITGAEIITIIWQETNQKSL